MNLFVALLLIFIVLYSAFILWCTIQWKAIKPVSSDGNFILPAVTVIIPVRNEEQNVVNCLNAVTTQQYPSDKIEILVVDDHSEDRTTQEVENFIIQHPKNIIRLLKLNTSKGGSKKEAITYAVQHAGNEILLTTDGDCIVPDSWIRTFVNAHSLQDVAFVAGPVSFLSGGGIFGSLQALEMMGLVGIAGAGIQSGKPMMCNGANISYTKSAFLKVDGFSSGYQLASGDDTQLLIKISGLKNGKMVFVKNSSALVLGTSVNSLSRLWQQRKRWASKIPVALTPFTVSVAVVAWFAHALLLASLIVSCIQPAGLPFFFVALVCKLGSEFFLLYSVCNQFNNRRLLLLFLPAQPLYWLYVTIIGILAPFGTYNWKGRNTK